MAISLSNAEDSMSPHSSSVQSRTSISKMSSWMKNMMTTKLGSFTLKKRVRILNPTSETSNCGTTQSTEQRVIYRSSEAISFQAILCVNLWLRSEAIQILNWLQSRSKDASMKLSCSMTCSRLHIEGDTPPNKHQGSIRLA